MSEQTTIVELEPKYKPLIPDDVNIVEELKTKVKAAVTIEQAAQIEDNIDAEIDKGANAAGKKKAMQIKASIRQAREVLADQVADTLAVDLEQHPIGAAVPKMSKTEMSALRQSMVDSGYHSEEPIVLYQGKILDGWHRYQMALKANVQPRFIDYRGDDPIGYVSARNVAARRQLTDDQRAAAAAALVELRHEADSVMDTVDKVAAAANVKASRVYRARLAAQKSAKLGDAIRDGEISVHDAFRISKDDELMDALNSGYDGSITDLASQATDPPPKVERVHLVTSQWTYRPLVFDSGGNELGEAWVRPIEDEPDPLTDDEIDAELQRIKESGVPMGKRELGRYLQNVDVHTVKCIYDSFAGTWPDDDMSDAKVRQAVAGFVIEWSETAAE